VSLAVAAVKRPVCAPVPSPARTSVPAVIAAAAHRGETLAEIEADHFAQVGSRFGACRTFGRPLRARRRAPRRRAHELII